MDAKALIMAMEMNVGNPEEAMARAEAIEVPGIEAIPSQTIETLKKKYGLMGQVAAYRKFIQFISRIKAAMEQEEAEAKAESAKKQAEEAAAANIATKEEGPVSEDQYKSPTGYHRRKQSSFRSQFNGTKSFGGIGPQTEDIESRLDNALKLLAEELSIQSSNSVLKADEGKFIIEGQVAIGNHADILKALSLWFMDNRPQVMHTAIDGITEMIKSGAMFK